MGYFPSLLRYTAPLLLIMPLTVLADFVVLSDSKTPVDVPAAKSQTTKDGPAVKALNPNPKPFKVAAVENKKVSEIIAEFVPEHWTHKVDPEIMDTRVSYAGGRNWLQVLQEVAKENGWSVNANKETQTLTLSTSPEKAKPKMATKVATAAADVETVKNSEPVKSNSGSMKAPAESMTSVVPDKVVAARPAAPTPDRFSSIKGSLDDKVSVNLRGKTLDQVLAILAPQGWNIDHQYEDYYRSSVVDYTGETTRSIALREVLEPLGMMHLPYPNMSPQPLIVIIEGAPGR